MDKPLKILCVSGWCRNGSTIMGNVLNEVPGFFHVGEMHFLWKNSVGDGANSLCGCGQPLSTCPVWSEIFALGKPEGVSAEEHARVVMARQLARVRTRHTWRVLKHGPRDEMLREHAALMTTTYHAAAERMGARVIVDSTKIPGEAALLPHMDGIVPYYLHLVRDPRAVAQSWSQEKDYCYVMSARKSTVNWWGFNVASRAITRKYPERSLFLRYEEFIADPSGTIDALLRFVEEDPGANPMNGRSIDLRPNHTVTGNPDRFASGTTVIRPRDNSWPTSLAASAKLAAVTWSWPLFGRYGYRYRGTFAAPTATVPAPRESTESASTEHEVSGVREKTVGPGA